METTMNKPEVHYVGELRIKEWPRYSNEDPIEYVGLLPEVLNHPRLGKCYDVRTSKIIRFPNKLGNFETRNTKYIRTYVPESLPYTLTGLSSESN
jgi:hypothetical protein